MHASTRAGCVGSDIAIRFGADRAASRSWSSDDVATLVARMTGCPQFMSTPGLLMSACGSSASVVPIALGDSRCAAAIQHCKPCKGLGELSNSQPSRQRLPQIVSDRWCGAHCRRACVDPAKVTRGHQTPGMMRRWSRMASARLDRRLARAEMVHRGWRQCLVALQDGPTNLCAQNAQLRRRARAASTRESSGRRVERSECRMAQREGDRRWPIRLDDGHHDTASR